MTTGGTDVKEPSLSAQELVEILRTAIVSGELVPKQRLVEADLAVEYGASRGNVRVALTELSVEGLVERVQNRGARVRAVSIEEAVEITEVRGALEALCARKAAERISDIEAASLRILAQEMEDAVSRGDREAYSACNQRLHAQIIGISAQVPQPPPFSDSEARLSDTNSSSPGSQAPQRVTSPTSGDH